MEKPKYNLLSLLPYLKNYKYYIFIVFISLIITSLAILSLGKIIKYYIDFGFTDYNYDYLLKISLISFFIILILAIAGYFRSYLINSVAQRIIFDIRGKIYNHIINISPEFFENNKIGDLISRMTNDANLLYNIISNLLSFFVRNFIIFIAALLFLFFINIKLTLVIFLIIFIAIIPILFLAKKIRYFSDIESKTLSISTSHIEETINFIKIVQAFLGQNKEISDFDQKLSKNLDFSLQKIRIRSLLISLIIIFAFGTVILILWLGSNDVISGQISSGDLSSFVFYTMLVATSAAGISRIFGQLSTASIACNRLFEILDFKSEIIDIKKSENILKKENINIKFQNVNFSYPKNPDQKILDNFNLDINRGQKIALIGKSGSGKSSIFEILLRFYNIQSGAILINGQNINEIPLSELRSLFSYISQDSVIFSGTIWENISYANPDISRKDAEDILQNQSFDFINKLPKKLDQFIGEKGVMLSGGERQRIAIARALLRNNPILLIDEFTSALDRKNQDLINKLLDKMAKDKIVINITHNKVNKNKYDQIVKL